MEPISSFYLFFSLEAKVIKFIPLTSNISLNWDHLQYLDVLNLTKAFECKVLERKRTVDLDLVALPCLMEKLISGS